MDLLPEDAFLLGYKPACVCQEGNPRLKPWLDRLKAGNYPYVFPMNILRDCYIFFHKESDRHAYIQTMKGVRINSTEYCEKLGHALGFPQHAIDFFCELWALEEKKINIDAIREKEGIGINCSGFMFVGHIPYLFEDIKWIWETYDHPEARKHPLIISHNQEQLASISFGDYRALEDLHICLNKQMMSKTSFSHD
jgi:hypothetical protein